MFVCCVHKKASVNITPLGSIILSIATSDSRPSHSITWADKNWKHLTTLLNDAIARVKMLQLWMQRTMSAMSWFKWLCPGYLFCLDWGYTVWSCRLVSDSQTFVHLYDEVIYDCLLFWAWVWVLDISMQT